MELDIGPIYWWLEWLVNQDQNEQWFFHDRLKTLLAMHTKSDTRESFLLEFNNPTSNFREVLSEILIRQSDLSIAAFTGNAISYLINDLRTAKIDPFHHGHLLGNIATEQFMAERLLPLQESATPQLLGNLRKVLKQAGLRHGRRYILE